VATNVGTLISSSLSPRGRGQGEGPDDPIALIDLSRPEHPREVTSPSWTPPATPSPPASRHGVSPAATVSASSRSTAPSTSLLSTERCAPARSRSRWTSSCPPRRSPSSPRMRSCRSSS